MIKTISATTIAARAITSASVVPPFPDVVVGYLLVMTTT
jgi:hypothetical protein